MFPPSDFSHSAVVGDAAEYSLEERRILLALAHRAIESGLADQPIDTIAPTEHLAEARGAFTTLHLFGNLRGCIGYVLPSDSLYQTVVETARAAAFDDPRFEPVTEDEAPHLKIEISVLSVPRPIRPNEIQVGKHGLIVTAGARRGLLLPQVPLEWEWDRETFLAQTCGKAGLPPDAWQRGAEIQAFTAEVFGEE
jgi:AmmeMemoRadiSam system protein A